VRTVKEWPNTKVSGAGLQGRKKMERGGEPATQQLLYNGENALGLRG